MNPEPESSDFGQYQPVYVRIRELIRDYPGDEGVFKELTQNADDGGASEIRFFLDLNDRKVGHVPVAGMQSLTGPAIFAVNNRSFSPEDIANIQSLGDSDKINTAAKTGRFGRGFNSVYNLTDYPQLVTGKDLYLFDPCSAIVGKSKAGKRWPLSDPSLAGPNGFLSLFAPCGFVAGSPSYDGTIFRFPLRNANDVKLNGNKISNQPFDPEEYKKLVLGLAGIAESVLLFLRNVEFIGCYELSENGTPRALLEIATENPAEVLAGRRPVNDYVNDDLEAVLSKLEQEPDGVFKSTYVHELSVTLGGKRSRSKWMVQSGLFAGEDDSLIEVARRLNTEREKALPIAGAAVCLRKDDVALPKISGQVSCFLPVAGVVSKQALPLHINAAFDLDGSRTGLTKRTEGETHVKHHRSKWNLLLIEHALSSVWADLMARIATNDPTVDVSDFYALWPRTTIELPQPLTALTDAVAKKLCDLPVIRAAGPKWTSVGDIRTIPDEPSLQRALVLEIFSIPDPPLPDAVRSLFERIDSAPEALDYEDVDEHFQVDDDPSCAIKDLPFPGLHKADQLEAVVRFLGRSPETNWDYLPLACCCDGKVHAFATTDPTPIYIATSDLRSVFEDHPEWFLDPGFVERTGIEPKESDGLATMTAASMVDRLASTGCLSEDGDSIEWEPDGKSIPNSRWIVKVLKVLTDAHEEDRPDLEALNKVALIPATSGELFPPGFKSTPLLVESRDRSLKDCLDTLGIANFVTAKDNLSGAIESFRKAYENFGKIPGVVWKLTPKDLADSLTGRASELEEDSECITRNVVDPLLCFLSSKDAVEEIEKVKSLQDELRQTPLFEDINGSFGKITENTYIPGDFHPPSIETSFRLLRCYGWEKLLALLGVDALSRRRFLEEVLLPTYADLPDEQQKSGLEWLCRERVHLIGDCESEEDASNLRSIIGEHPLVKTVAGDIVSIQELYHPEESLVAAVLGDQASLPDMKFYGGQSLQWLEFFEAFGMSRSPRAQDLLSFVEDITTRVEEESSAEAVTPQIEQFLAHITREWSQLRAVKVEAQNGTAQTFGEALSKLAWCPVIRDGKRLAEFGSWRVPEDRLFLPSELYLAERGNLVASQRPLLKQGQRGPDTEMRRDLGFNETTLPSLVFAHWKHLLDHVPQKGLSDDQDKIARTPCQSILEYFGGLDSSEATSNEVVSLLGDLNESPCIYHFRERRFVRPCDVFKQCPETLAPWKIPFVPKGRKQGTLEVALERLGQRLSPNLADHLEVLIRISEFAASGEALSEVDAEQFLDVQRLLSGHLDQQSNLAGCMVLDVSLSIRRADEVFESDDPWLEQRMRTGIIPILHPETPLELSHMLGVRRLTQEVSKSPCGSVSRSRDASFVDMCGALQDRFLTNEFRSGFSRLASASARAKHEPIPALPDYVILQPVVSLVCRYSVDVNGVPFDLVEAEDDVCVTRDSEDEVAFYLSEQAKDDVPDAMARLIKELLKPFALADTAALVSILRCPLDQIDKVLDRRHIPRTKVPVHGAVISNVQSGDIIYDEVVLEDASKASDNQADDEDLTHDKRDRSGSDRSMNIASLSDKGRDLVGRDASTDAERIPRGGRTGPRSGTADGTPRSGSSKGDGHQSPTGRSSPPAPKDRLMSYVRPAQAPDQAEDSDPANDEQPKNHLVGDAAVGWVLQYEIQQGRKPENQAHNNTGYDVISRHNRTSRYIEVKGLLGAWGKDGVPISLRQFEFGNKEEFRDHFWLYIVEFALEPDKVKIHAIPNPVVRINQFRFDPGWSALETQEPFKPLLPQVGQRVRFKDREGELKEGRIISVGSNNPPALGVRFAVPPDDIIPRYDPTVMILLPSEVQE